MQRVFSTCALGLMIFCTFCLPVFAGDFATRHIHGFSANGKLFAFEEYGVQDGSGFPYSNVYVIDVASDTWTAGSPFRVLLKSENQTVFAAREQARILAGTVMKSFEERGHKVATYRATQSGVDKHRVVANPRPVVPSIDAQIEFRLIQKTFPPTDLCAPFGPSTGFRLFRIARSHGEKTRSLHDDQTIPDSRGCPIGYEFSDLVTYFPADGTRKFALLLLVLKQGFEGPDGRFMAVTGSLD